MNLTALVIERADRRPLAFGVQVFTLDYVISPIRIWRVGLVPGSGPIDCDQDDFSATLAEFLMEYGAIPAVFVTVKDWQKYLRPDQYLQMDARYLEVAYTCRPTIDDHLLAIQTEVQEGRYQWKNR